MLETILGPGRSTVKVSAVLDMTNETIEKIEYDKGIATKDISTTTSKEQLGGTNADGRQTSPSTTDTSETIENEYKLPGTVRQIVGVPGEIVSLAVAATVDLSVPEPPADEENAQEGANVEQTTTESKQIMTIEEVKSIIRNAAGPSLLKDKDSGEELLTVVNIPFARPIITTVDDAAGYQKFARYIEIARQSSMGILAICALLVLKIFAGAKKKAGTSAIETTAAGQAGPLALGILPAGTGQQTSVALRQHVATELRQNPEQVKQLFASWLAEG